MTIEELDRRIDEAEKQWRADGSETYRIYLDR